MSRETKFERTIESEVTIEVTQAAADDESWLNYKEPGAIFSEWRGDIYGLVGVSGVLDHFAWNAVQNGVTDASHLDGWADLEHGTVTMTVKTEFPS